MSSNSVENLFVTPLIRLEKEKDPPPYLKNERNKNIGSQDTNTFLIENRIMIDVDRNTDIDIDLY